MPAAERTFMALPLSTTTLLRSGTRCRKPPPSPAGASPKPVTVFSTYCSAPSYPGSAEAAALERVVSQHAHVLLDHAP